MLRVLGVRAARSVFLTPAKDVKVLRAFPPAVSTAESSPFLFVDLFGPTVSDGEIDDVDTFPMPWHPHCGHDVLTYLISGRGRHADSMGNRGTFDAPGIQWLSAGSGIEHTEGGGTPAGEIERGIQMWINVPRAHKLDAPSYGAAQELPEIRFGEGVSARLIAGEVGGSRGPFSSVQPLLMLDVTLPAYGAFQIPVPDALDNALCVVHSGSASVNRASAAAPSTVLLDAGAADHDQAAPVREGRAGAGRVVAANAGPDGAAVLLLAGRRIREPVSWRGTFVLSSEAELAAAEGELRSGRFPRVRAAWDYKRLADFPISHPARLSCGLGPVVAAPAAPGVEGSGRAGRDAAVNPHGVGA
jgi:quercetin 2,3-dioxygenase